MQRNTRNITSVRIFLWPIACGYLFSRFVDIYEKGLFPQVEGKYPLVRPQYP